MLVAVLGVLVAAVANRVRRCNRFEQKKVVSRVCVLAVLLCSFNEARLPKTWGFLKQIRYLFVTFAGERHVAPVFI
jgi:hypothetical protein